MKKLFLMLSVTLTALCLATSCDKEEEKHPDFAQMISAENITVTPNPLEAIGGKVPVSIEINVPAHFTYPTAEVNLSAIFVWDNGEVRSSYYGGFQGSELPDMGNKVISYETGGNVMMKSSFDYVPEMAKSKLFFEFDVFYKGQHTIFRFKVADGVIAS